MHLDGTGVMADASGYQGGGTPARTIHRRRASWNVFHRSLKAEVLQGKWFTDAGELQRAFDHWRTVYNLERPHEALDMAVPASRYQPSARQFRSNVEPPEYDEGVVVRKVDIRG